MRLMIASLALTGAGMAGGCSQPAKPTPPPPAVSVITVAVTPVENVVELPARVQAYRIAEVRARVDGIVQRRLFTEGSIVGADQPLFVIDPRDMQAATDAARATLLRSQATAANDARIVARYDRLIAAQAISRQEYDTAVSDYRSAQADVANSQAQLRRAQLNLSYTTVTAPIGGRARRAEVTEGALVSASGGTLLTTIEQIDRVYVNFSQSSSDLLALRNEIISGKLKLPGLRRVQVRLVLEDGSVSPIVGYLDFADLSIDENTGTAALRAEFPNPGDQLLPGQFVRARISAGIRADGILIPQRAVAITPEGASVMVVDTKGFATLRPIKLGDMKGDQWLVLSGLKPGDKVIIDGLQGVRPGAPVSITRAKQ